MAIMVILWILPSLAKAQAQAGLSWLYSQLIQPPQPRPARERFFSAPAKYRYFSIVVSLVSIVCSLSKSQLHKSKLSPSLFGLLQLLLCASLLAHNTFIPFSFGTNHYCIILCVQLSNTSTIGIMISISSFQDCRYCNSFATQLDQT